MIYLLINNEYFQQEEYGEDAIILESTLDNIPLGKWQNVIQYQIS